MLFSFTHLWQQAELSDVDVLLTAPSADPQQGDAAPQKLADFPGHTALLSSSPYLRAQILRWQRKRPLDQTAAGVSRRRSSASSSSTQQTQQDTSKPQLVLALQDASEQPAAMAVLAALYGAKPVSELLSELSQEQQLQAALLADMWQLPAISTRAAKALASTLTSQGKLSEAVTQQLLHLQAVPDCLQALSIHVLLQLLGNLEQCWTDPILRDRLLQLPLSSMELLLSCNRLQVASEDTVLYTVQQYMANTSDDAAKQRIEERLGPLIRCQHLSHYWLLLSLVSDDADTMPLAQLRPQLKQLLTMRSARAGVTVGQLYADLEDAPSSWLLGQRSITAVNTVQLTWVLGVSTLRETAQRCVAQQRTQYLISPTATAPLGGMPFEVQAICEPEAAAAAAVPEPRPVELLGYLQAMQRAHEKSGRWLGAEGAVSWLLCKLDVAESVWAAAAQVAAAGGSSSDFVQADFALVASSDADMDFFCSEWSNEVLEAAGVTNDGAFFTIPGSSSAAWRARVRESLRDALTRLGTAEAAAAAEAVTQEAAAEEQLLLQRGKLVGFAGGGARGQQQRQQQKAGHGKGKGRQGQQQQQQSEGEEGGDKKAGSSGKAKRPVSGAATIGLYVGPRGVPSDANYSFTYTLQVHGILSCAQASTSGTCHASLCSHWGDDNFFGVGTMEGGWDEVAWASKGLPAAGSLLVKLSVSKVGHMANTAQ